MRKTRPGEAQKGLACQMPQRCADGPAKGNEKQMQHGPVDKRFSTCGEALNAVDLVSTIPGHTDNHNPVGFMGDLMLPKIAALAMACTTLAGCGTMVRGTTEDVRILVEPDDATVTTSLGHRCNAMPCTVNVARRDQFTVTASKEGYVTESVDVGTKVSGGGAAGFAGNIVAGGVVGMGVDVATGVEAEPGRKDHAKVRAFVAAAKGPHA